MFVFIAAIQSLDSVNEQILAFVFPLESQLDNHKSPITRAHLHGQESRHVEDRQTEAIKTTLGLMRNLLLDAQVS